MVDQSGRRLLPLDGHGQGYDGQFRPHVATHCPAGDFANEEVQYGGEIEPPILGWQAGEAGRAKPRPAAKFWPGRLGATGKS